MKNELKSTPSQLRAVAAYYLRNQEEIKAKHRLYREKHRAKRLAYGKAYREAHGIRPRTIKPPRPIRAPKPKPQVWVARKIECELCDNVVDIGSHEYFEGTMTDAGFICCLCL